MSKIRVIVWNENVLYKNEAKAAEVARTYPKGMHNAIADFLKEDNNFEVKTATLEEPFHSLGDEVLNNTDVLLWWGHQAHDRVAGNKWTCT